MIIKGELTGVELEYFMFEFTVDQETVIEIKRVKAPFEHFFLQVEDPSGKLVAVFTFKTRQDKWIISNDESLRTSGSVEVTTFKGTWHCVVVSPGKTTGAIELDVSTYVNPQEYEAKASHHECSDGAVVNTMKRWYAGDLHLHTNLSDGRIELEYAEDAFMRSDLDYLSITDHSVLMTHKLYKAFPNLMGTEITWDNDGHYNVHGLESIDELDYFKFASQSKTKHEALIKLMNAFKEMGRVLTLNHPFPYGMRCGHPLDIRLFTCIEVMNAPHLLFEEIDNGKARDFFDFLWKQGHTLTAVGGSDAHKENYFGTYPIGMPTTHILCDGLSQQNLLNGLIDGHTIITCFHKVELVFKYEGKEVYPGDICIGMVECFSRSLDSLTWVLIKNGDRIEEKHGSTFTTSFEIQENTYVRLEAYNSEGQCVLFTNPIHAMTRKAEEFCLLNLIEKFEKERF